MRPIDTALHFAITLYIACRSIYRLYFHPPRKIPGPKLAAITHAYEFDYDVIKGGLLIWRECITPRTIHITDPDYYEEIYASRARKREKDLLIVARFDLEGFGFSSITDDDHRPRRAPSNQFFSKQTIVDIEYLIHESLDKLVHHLRTAYNTHLVVHLDATLQCSADGINALFQMTHLTLSSPFMQTLINALPLDLLRKVSAPAYALARQKKDLYECGAAALKASLSSSKSGHTTFTEAIAEPKMPEHLRTPERLMNEGFALTIGGTQTTAQSLAVALYHLIDRPETMKGLREELKQSGVVNETLRLSTGVATFSPRIAPTEALQYKGHIIPPGTPVAQTHYFILMNPNIFPDPHAFETERWIRAAQAGNCLVRYLINFSKGSRMCVGLNLAFAALYLIIATLACQFEIKLYETPRSTIELARDFGTPYPIEGHMKVQVMVTGLIDG
ncbi:cytochrome P450 [Aspergillus saccharolyticus JOP 1030-1]|uniref:Cytochrome P450 n=1 Tax=Aspergillus saccharolyticus JOP 1030-1 TaxID=1450539 RepID=A0A318ZEC6_9EURO|nr:cytochrome P450 [Aspergillus saccharolyticus JOP 1030-1]PYH45739.1 cytochrome P450 [Aspergillus saccharolyticus JOP 1030-1]